MMGFGNNIPPDQPPPSRKGRGAKMLRVLDQQMRDADALGLDLVALKIAEAIDQLVDDCFCPIILGAHASRIEN
ncbi:MAG: hypothetical protein RIQ68_741 [Pseudomonadota bacterium]|jgi:hypothetical protein